MAWTLTRFVSLLQRGRTRESAERRWFTEQMLLDALLQRGRTRESAERTDVRVPGSCASAASTGPHS